MRHRSCAGAVVAAAVQISSLPRMLVIDRVQYQPLAPHNCEDNGSAENEARQRKNLGHVGCFKSHASPLVSIKYMPLSVVPVTRIGRLACALFPNNASVPCAIVTLLPSLPIEREKRVHQVVKANRTFAARHALQAGCPLERIAPCIRRSIGGGSEARRRAAKARRRLRPCSSTTRVTASSGRSTKEA